MINAIIAVMSRPITFVLVTLFALSASIYAALTVEMLDLIRLINLAMVNAILIALQILVILVNRLLRK